MLGGLAGLAGVATSIKAASIAQTPQGPMLLSRRLVRGLSDGNRIEVRRLWRVAFVRRQSGMALIGRQVGVSVEAPERLAPIAAIERERSTDNKFPIIIDESGLIVGAGEAENASDVDRAIHAAQQIAQENGASKSQQQQLRAALQQVQAAGSSLLDRLPKDLFFPRSSGFAEQRAINLPGGVSGQFEVTYSVSAHPISGLLDHADRHIVTRLGDSAQASSEHWELREI